MALPLEGKPDEPAASLRRPVLTLWWPLTPSAPVWSRACTRALAAPAPVATGAASGARALPGVADITARNGPAVVNSSARA